MKEREFKENADEFNEKRAEEKRESLFANKENPNIVKFPRLELTVSSAKYLDDKKVIVVTPNSINNKLKKLGERFYFGREDKYSNKQNDFNFNDESIGVRQFDLSYNKEKNKFYVVDNKRGTGLFVKIKTKIAVSQDMIVSFCASHMILQIENDRKIIIFNIILASRADNKIVKIRFLQGPHQNQEWSFNSRDKKLLRIGRSKSAEIVYKDDSVSRIQCTLLYEDSSWVLYDGSFEDTGLKISTNGLW